MGATICTCKPGSPARFTNKECALDLLSMQRCGSALDYHDDPVVLGSSPRNFRIFLRPRWLIIYISTYIRHPFQRFEFGPNFINTYRCVKFDVEVEIGKSIE